MNIQCSEVDTLLLEGDRFSMEIAERHGATCAACAQKLAEWNEISTTAQGMKAAWQNEMLWPRIDRALQKAVQRKSLWRPWMQVAASVAIFAFLSVIVWTAHVRMKANEFDKQILRVAAVDEVERQQQALAHAIENLEKQTDTKLDDPATPLLVSYKEKLMLLDDAISQCEDAIKQNRKNAHLRKQLMAMYSEKQQTLQNVLREETTNVSNQ